MPEENQTSGSEYNSRHGRLLPDPNINVLSPKTTWSYSMHALEATGEVIRVIKTDLSGCRLDGQPSAQDQLRRMVHFQA